jgi:hypothetical protein
MCHETCGMFMSCCFVITLLAVHFRVITDLQTAAKIYVYVAILMTSILQLITI